MSEGSHTVEVAAGVVYQEMSNMIVLCWEIHGVYTTAIRCCVCEGSAIEHFEVS